LVGSGRSASRAGIFVDPGSASAMAGAITAEEAADDPPGPPPRSAGRGGANTPVAMPTMIS